MASPEPDGKPCSVGRSASEAGEEEEETWLETKVNDLLDLWDSFRYFLWNPYTSRIMGRTKKSLGERQGESLTTLLAKQPLAEAGDHGLESVQTATMFAYKRSCSLHLCFCSL